MLHMTRCFHAARRWLAFACALLLCLAPALQAAPQPSTTEGRRFLFIVDSSLAMKPMEKAVQETVFDLVYSGMRDHMRDGDTFGIWLVTDRNDTSFPMQVWKQKFALETAAKVATVFTPKMWKERANLGLAMADAMDVVKNVGELTIVLVSNGETPIVGTVFDAAINHRWREHAAEHQKLKKTINTVLAAQDGEVVAWSVNAPGFLIDMPSLPPRKPRPATVVQNVPEKSAPEPATASVTAPREKTAPAPARVNSPIIITKQTVEKERRAYQALTMTGAAEETNAVAVSQPTTNAVVAETAAVAVPAVTNAPADLSTSKPVAVVAVATPFAVTTTTNAAPAAEPAASVPPTAPKSPVAPAPVSSGVHPMLWLLSGAALTVLGCATAFVLLRSRRREPSLISQAMVQQRFH
jgi:hypothetical protein